jgi:hypothetical protein
MESSNTTPTAAPEPTPESAAPSSAPSSLRRDLNSKSQNDLEKLAAERNIEGRSGMSKKELVKALEESYTQFPPRIG